MAEIEITTSGEIKLAGDVAGQITWSRPFVEAEVAGIYDDHGYGYDEFGDPFDCSGCDKRQGLLDDLKKSCDEINAIGARIQDRITASDIDDDELDGLVRKIREISDAVETKA